MDRFSARRVPSLPSWHRTLERDSAKFPHEAERSLGNDESIVAIVRSHWAVLVRPTLVALGLVVVGSLVELYLPLHSIVVTVVGLGIVVVGCSYFFVHYLEWRHAFMTVTTKRILLEKGVFTTSTRAIPLSKIDDVACKQSLLGKIFNFGGLTIDNANLEGGEALACVADPLSVRRLITNTTSAPKQTPPQAPSPTYDHPAQASSLVDELERLARLYSDGFITLVEFEASKARLLRDR